MKILKTLLFLSLILFYSCDNSNEDDLPTLVEDEKTEEVPDDNEEDEDLVDIPFSEPPFWGTIFVSNNILTQDDPSVFGDIDYVGTGTRTMYDRRSGWVTLQPYLFMASYNDGLAIEFQINPEFTLEEAHELSSKYALEIGRLPHSLRVDVETSWIHKGNEAYGGGNKNLLIHTGRTAEYEADGILLETLIHEGTHTSIDEYHKDQQAWKDAQTADNLFISQYAQDNPEREDLAETLLLWYALRYQKDRISQGLQDTIKAAIPNRIKYLDGIDFN